VGGIVTGLLGILVFGLVFVLIPLAVNAAERRSTRRKRRNPKVATGDITVLDTPDHLFAHEQESAMTTWRPTGVQWLVITLAAGLGTITAGGRGGSPVAVALFLLLDGALIVWWLEGLRKR
jgi:hypothetical protein